MTTIWKYPLLTGAATPLELPQGAELLHVDIQGRDLCLWAKVNTDLPTTPRTIEVFGTGHPMPSFERQFINTFLVDGGTYVFHAFERLT